jgi:hypothetical protein
VDRQVNYSAAAQSVILTAAVTSPAGTVGEGSVTFTVYNGATAVGSPATGNVVAGSATATYNLPAGLAVGTYIIKAAYSGTGNYTGFIDSSHTLTVVGSSLSPVALPGGGSGDGGNLDAIVSNGVGTSTSSSGHKVKRTKTKVNHGPLSSGHTVSRKPLSSGRSLPVADRLPLTHARKDHLRS